MIKRIELKNFMSHTHTVIEPAEGLTVLVGPNNCGKSAVVVALQILAHNEKSTYVMRHGERECSVRIETDDGHDIEWRRKKSPSYLIDGQEFSRLGQTEVPDELHRALRMPKIDAGSNSAFDVHIGAQKTPIFLLESSESNAARFFASSSDAAHLMQMQKRHQERVTETRRDKKRLDKRSIELNEHLRTLEPIVTIHQWVQALETLRDEIRREATRLADLHTQRSAILAQQRQVTHRHDIVSVLERLAAPPHLEPTRELQAAIEGLRGGDRSRRHAHEQTRALSLLAPPPSMAETIPLRQSIRHARELARTAKLQRRILKSLTPLTDPPRQESTSELLSLRRRMQNGVARHRQTAAAALVFQELTGPPELAEKSRLRPLLEQIQTADAVVLRHRRAVQVLESLPPELPVPATHEATALIVALREAADVVGTRRTDLVTATSAVEESERALRAASRSGVCHACGAPLDADRVVAHALAGVASGGGHAHG